jgi:hypothetical protein
MLYTFITLFAKTRAECTNGFLGLKPWYHYLELDSNCDIKDFNFFPPNGDDPLIKSDVPLVLLAVIDDLLRIAGLVAVAFVIIGAINYITSQGNPEDTAKAQSTIVNALIGLAISIVAVAFVSFIGSKLGP